jgi:hypothetical protein
MFTYYKMYKNQYGTGFKSDIFGILKNTLALPDENKGEFHLALLMPDGEFKKAQFAGPGTDIVNRLDLNGLTLIDQISKEHDLAYALTSKIKDKKERLKQVRIADDKMIERLNKAKDKKLDNKANIFVAKSVIQGKKLLETGKIGKKLKEKMEAISNPGDYTVEEYEELVGEKEKTSKALTQKGVGMKLSQKYKNK